MSKHQLNGGASGWRLKGLIAPQSALLLEMSKGERLVVVDVEGGQSANLYCSLRADPGDGFSASRSIDYNHTIYPTKGDILYSASSRPLLRIVEDTLPGGKHDILLGACTVEKFQRLSGTKEQYRNCQENLRLAFQAQGIALLTVPTTFNIFANVSVGTDGVISVAKPKSRTNDSMQFEVLNDLYIGLSACADEFSGGASLPIQYEVYSRS